MSKQTAIKNDVRKGEVRCFVIFSQVFKYFIKYLVLANGQEMSLCLNLNDVENIDGIYAALNKYGVCVDYDDEKQMELKKRIIIVSKVFFLTTKCLWHVFQKL